MSGDLTYRVTFEDCFAVSSDVEKEYDVAITWRVHARSERQKWKYSVQLTAWRFDGDKLLAVVCNAYAAWPAQQVGSLPGSILNGLYDLESRLSAQRTLEGLPLDGGL